ncbi:Uncharacterised protein [Mycobacteroides abscessus subsp. abscessus]|nr:Uncharacterised protein [Mycobacteroides abscessus subsp. abscessus]
MPCPAMSGAEPCTDSNMEMAVRSGLIFPDAASPSPPVIAAAKSERMSPKRFEATMTSRLAGSLTMRAASASTCIDTDGVCGYSAAISLKMLSQ